MLLKEYYRFLVEVDIPDDEMIKYKQDGENKEMKAGSAKTMSKDHPAKIEYDKMVAGDDDSAKKGVNIFDKPADEPADEPKSGDIQAIGKNTPAKKASSPEVQHISDYFFEQNKNSEVDASDAASFALTHYKALTGDEYDFEENYFPGEVEDFMETVVGDNYDWQEDWNSAHEGWARSYDEGDKIDNSEEIPPMDKPKSEKPSDDKDAATKIHRSGAMRSKDDIDKILMNDPEIVDMLGDDFYWDGDNLVSKKYDDQTITSIDYDHVPPMKTIGDLKQAIKQFADNAEKAGGEKPSSDDDKQIGGPNGLEIDRDDIRTALMNDPKIAKILGDEDDVYWDDADLVSSKWDDETVASIDPDSDETIGDLKQRIIDFAMEKQNMGKDPDDIDDISPDAVLGQEGRILKKGALRKIKENWIKENYNG